MLLSRHGGGLQALKHKSVGAIMDANITMQLDLLFAGSSSLDGSKHVQLAKSCFGNAMSN